ncbi:MULTISPECIES: hypothetical protein [unclassified Enterococcus]|jgi:hypothetical protein|uniref:hypothetical protein n=1 Tax=unclassified Enterococcus TaxID=2608891 RepID=UPI003D2B2AF4
MKKISLAILSVLGVTMLSSVLVNAETIQGQESATVPVTGQIKEFDPENPDEGEEENPEIPDDQWIKVDIPSSVSFAASEASNGNVISPTYTIKNRSAEGVKVSVDNFASRGTENALFGGTVLDLSSESTTVNLRHADDTFISARTELMSLAGNIVGGQPTETQEEKTFSMTGKLGDSFDFTQIPTEGVSQTYDLVFNFERVAD